MKLFAIYLQVICLAVLPLSLRAEDVLDVETEMEDAFQDSEAAQLESKDALVRQAKKEQDRDVAEEKAQNAIAKAQAKKHEAIQEITHADKEIQIINKQIAAADSKRIKAEAEFNASSAKIERKKQELSRHKMELEAKEKFLSEQKQKSSTAAEEARRTEAEILEVKDRMSKASQDFQRAKKENLEVQARQIRAEKRLAQERAASSQQLVSLGESLKTVKAKARNPSSVGMPRSLNLKTDCKAYAGPEALGTPVWSGAKGQTVTAQKHNSNWARVNLPSGKNGFMAKACF